jgi:hypothetical protein
MNEHFTGRCVFEPSKEQGACFVTDDEKNCKREEFKIHSGSSAKIKCVKGYTFFVLGKEVRGQQEIACDKGTYPEFRCTASKQNYYLQSFNHLYVKQRTNLNVDVNEFE